MPTPLHIALHGGAFARAPALFWVDFILYPAAVAALLFTGETSWLIFAAGFVLFTFAEYWAHRSVLHEVLYHGSHEHHHRNPRAYIMFPVYYVPAFFLGLYLVLPVSLFAGFTAGYCWFVYWHHVLHHFDLNRWPGFVRRYALWHLGHHNDEDVNFGITTSIWDTVFWTWRKS